MYIGSLKTLQVKEANLIKKIERIEKEFSPPSQQAEALERAKAGLKEVRDAMRTANKETNTNDSKKSSK